MCCNFVCKVNAYDEIYTQHSHGTVGNSLTAFLASCAESYNIKGTSNMSTLDGRMLYLKVLKNNDFSNVDSCDVVHGEFQFAGNIDTVRMANIFMDNESVLPLILKAATST